MTLAHFYKLLIPSILLAQFHKFSVRSRRDVHIIEDEWKLLTIKYNLYSGEFLFFISVNKLDGVLPLLLI